METFLVSHASVISTYVFFGMIILTSLLECVAPNHRTAGALGLRWIGNITIYFVCALIPRLIFPMLSFGFATICAEKGWGLLNHVALPWWLEFALTVILLDLASYALHFLSHHITPLWRLHRLHHTDQDIDFSTGIRHHPLETIIAIMFSIGVIFATGATPVAVLISQWLFQCVMFFSHANLRVPSPIERVLSRLLVTPNMHCIHHSVDLHESNSNFGNLFPWWDRLFGTYISGAAIKPEEIMFGVSEFIGRQHLMLPWMIAQPFLRGSIRPSHDDKALDKSGLDGNRI